MADFIDKIESIGEKIGGFLNKTSETPAVNEESSVFQDNQVEEDKKEQNREEQYRQAENYKQNIASPDSSDTKKETAKEDLSLYARLRNGIKSLFQTSNESDKDKQTTEKETKPQGIISKLTGFLSGNKKDEKNETNDKPDESKDSNNSGSSLKDKLSSAISKGTSNGNTQKANTASKNETKTTNSNLFNKINDFFSNITIKPVSNNSNNNSNQSNSNNTTTNNNDSGNDNPSKETKSKFATAISVIKTSINQIGKLANAIKVSSSNTNTELENIANSVDVKEIQSGSVDVTDVDSGSLEDLQNSEKQLKAGIATNTEILESIKNGSNSILKSASDGYINSVEAYRDALDVSNNPAVVSLQNQITSINDCITQQKSQLMQFDQQIADVSDYISKQDFAIAKLSGAISSYTDQISMLQDALNGDIDSESAAMIKASISELKSARNSLVNQQLQAKRDREDAQYQQEALNRQKNDTQKSIREYRHTANNAQIQMQHLKDTIIYQARSAMVKSLEILEKLKSSMEKQLESEIANAKNQLLSVQSDISEIADKLPQKTDEGSKNTDKDIEAAKAVSATKSANKQTGNDSVNITVQSEDAGLKDFAQNTNFNEVYQISNEIDSSNANEMESEENKAENIQDDISQLNSDIIQSQMRTIAFENRLDEIDIEIQELAGQYIDLESYDLSSVDKKKADEIETKKTHIANKMEELMLRQKEIKKQQEMEHKETASKINSKNIYEKIYDDTTDNLQRVYLAGIEEIERLKEQDEDIF